MEKVKTVAPGWIPQIDNIGGITVILLSNTGIIAENITLCICCEET
jgi:hypothetical protein